MQQQHSVAPARGALYRRLLDEFAAKGEVVACEARYAIFRTPRYLARYATYVYQYGIGCFMCGKISWNPTDVDAHYCDRCKMFHDSN
jgi:hypothetical protein